MNNQCRACGSAVYNSKGRNLFQKQNAKLLLNINLVTNKLLKKDPRLPSCICASCEAYLNRTDMFRVRFLETQENLMQRRAGLPENDLATDDNSRGETSNADVTAQDADSLISGLEKELGGKTDFDGTDAYETAQVADLLITSLQKDSGHVKNSSHTENIIKAPKQLAEKSTFRSSRSTRITSKNAAQIAKSHPLSVKTLKRRSCIMSKLKCKSCDQTFVTPSGLTRHMRAHTAETSFKCTYCARAFSTKGNTIRHERTHTRQAAFPCSTCGMSFSLAFVLKRHIYVRHTQMSVQRIH